MCVGDLQDDCAPLHESEAVKSIVRQKFGMEPGIAKLKSTLVLGGFPELAASVASQNKTRRRAAHPVPKLAEQVGHALDCCMRGSSSDERQFDIEEGSTIAVASSPTHDNGTPNSGVVLAGLEVTNGVETACGIAQRTVAECMVDSDAQTLTIDELWYDRETQIKEGFMALHREQMEDTKSMFQDALLKRDEQLQTYMAKAQQMMEKLQENHTVAIDEMKAQHSDRQGLWG